MGRASSNRFELTGDQIARTRNLSDAAAGAFLRLVRVTYATKAAFMRDALAGMPRGVREELERAGILSGEWFLPAREWASEVERNRLAARDAKMSARMSAQMSARTSARKSAQMSAPAFRADIRTDTTPGESSSASTKFSKKRAASRESENVRTEVCTEVRTEVREDVEPIRTASRAAAAHSTDLDRSLADLDDATTTTTDPVFDDLDEPPPTPSSVPAFEVPSADDPEAMRAALEAARRRLSHEDRTAIARIDTASHVSTCVRVA
jgi:hypothetical protein